MYKIGYIDVRWTSQSTGEDVAWRPFPEVGPGANEIRIDCADGWFRVMYVAKFEEAVYVLHSFQKKTRKTNRGDVEIARTRYRAVVQERKTSR